MVIQTTGRVRSGRPDGNGRTSGQGKFCNIFCSRAISAIIFCLLFLHHFSFHFVIYAPIFILYYFIMNWVLSKFPFCIIWKVSISHFWPNFKNFFNCAIWNFEMILKILFEKYFSKLLIFYLIFYVHHLFLKIIFFKRFSKKGY